MMGYCQVCFPMQEFRDAVYKQCNQELGAIVRPSDHPKIAEIKKKWEKPVYHFDAQEFYICADCLQQALEELRS